ncbi:MAG: hypothetical protein PHR22_03985 [Candidatus Omnitrophica bacterium]|nr:hypothetical protein [Candidatus Omnitrophota bacterium]
MRRRGFVLIVTFIFVLALAAMAMVTVSLVSTNTKFTGSQLDGAKALYLAQAGVENVLRSVRDGHTPPSVPAPITLGDGTVEYLSVGFPTPNNLAIDLLGKVPAGPSSGKEIKAHVVAVYSDSGNGKFTACSSWEESYE